MHLHTLLFLTLNNSMSSSHHPPHFSISRAFLRGCFFWLHHNTIPNERAFLIWCSLDNTVPTQLSSAFVSKKLWNFTEEEAEQSLSSSINKVPYFLLFYNCKDFYKSLAVTLGFYVVLCIIIMEISALPIVLSEVGYRRASYRKVQTGFTEVKVETGGTGLLLLLFFFS